MLTKMRHFLTSMFPTAIVVFFLSFPLNSFCQLNNLFTPSPTYVANIKNASENNEISSKCQQQLVDYHLGLLTVQLWAWSMYDANAKDVPSGLLNGNFFELGNFDECLSVTAETFKGKYCLGTIPIPGFGTDGRVLKKRAGVLGGQLRTLGTDPTTTGLHFGYCVPDGCTAEDVGLIHTGITFYEKYCYSKDTQPEFDTGAIITVAILGLILVIVCASTAYDTFLHYTGILTSNEVTIAFSWLTNGKKLITPTTNQDQLLCLNGFKALSMIWIVVAHETVNGSSAPVANFWEVALFPQDMINMTMISATLAVDTFFVVGGLLTMYTFLTSMDKGAKFNIFRYYIHRYIRLTPTLAIVVLVHVTLLKLLGEAPLWNSFDDHLVEPCKKHWWAALLYIQNYVHDDQACVPQSWYLSIDMQLFILSPLILIPIRKWPKMTFVYLVVIVIAGVFAPFMIAYLNKLTAFMTDIDIDDTHKFMFAYYEQTYGRFGAYVIGMILGYFVYKVKKGEIKIKLRLLPVLAIWAICLSGLLACVYAGHDTMLAEYNRLAHSLYIAFNRPAWSLAVSVLIFACVTGHGGPVDAFLSAPIFQVISKLSYAIYLVHYEFIIVRAASHKATVYIDTFGTFFDFWGDFMFSVMLSVPLCLSFEMPMIVIEKLLFSKCSHRKSAVETKP